MIARVCKWLLSDREFAALKSFVDEFRIKRNHQRGSRYVRKHYAGRRDLRVQFGCGPNPHPGWLNTDLWPGPWAKPDFCVDVARTLLFEDGSVIEIYSEHMFEHLDYPQTVVHFLGECRRVLAPDGKMTIGVPEVEGILASYRDAGDRLTPPAPNETAYCVLGHPLERMNYYFHQGGEHKFLYSYPFFHRLLEHCGFDRIHQREFNPAEDTEIRRGGTLYIVGQKPAVKQPG